MSRAIDVEKAIEIIETKQKELCPVGRYGRNYVYGSDREKYDAWDEIIDVLENLPTLTPPNEWVIVKDAVPDPGERVFATDGIFLGEAYRSSANSWFRHTGFPWMDGVTGRTVRFWTPMPAPLDRRPPEGGDADHA